MNGPNLLSKLKKIFLSNFQSLESVRCWLSQSIWIFSDPDNCSAWMVIFFWMHQVQISLARSDKGHKWLPPNLFKKEITVILSIR